VKEFFLNLKSRRFS